MAQLRQHCAVEIEVTVASPEKRAASARQTKGFDEGTSERRCGAPGACLLTAVRIEDQRADHAHVGMLFAAL